MLQNISSPKDLKNIPTKDLPQLCTELRELIIQTVAKNGGHLAPSLGVVELSVALHYVFDSPEDKIIWDVGHQAYAHKILTGRRDKFHTLRQSGGISGFPKREESKHDVFGAGHASTSISAALGIAKALKREGKENKVIAVIGDGSMTGGLAFEGLNQAGHKVNNLITVLNDNEMSISKNVGALSRFLSWNIHGKHGRKISLTIQKILSRIPFFGKRIYDLTQRAEEAAISFLTPGFLFEAFGFNYIGPLDGHNLTDLIQVFQDLKAGPAGNKPLVVHILTKKGKGYLPAESDPTKFHGTGAFDCDSGNSFKSEAKTQSYTQAFGQAMLDLAAQDKDIVAITAAMCTGTGLQEFAETYPERFYDVGIAEGHAVTFAAGLATQGLRPVVAIYSTFLQRAYDNIVHDVCLQKLPVIFAIDRAGLVGEDGPTHHGVFDISYLRTIPNLSVLAPRDEKTLQTMLSFAAKHTGPVAIRYPRGNIPAEDLNYLPQEFKLGSAEIVHYRKGAKAIIIAVGHLVIEAIQAARKLEIAGIKTVVIDPRFIKPFDFNLLKTLLQNCSNLITVEENAIAGGFGSMIGEWLFEQGFSKVSLKNLGIPDEFVTQGPQADLRAKCGIDATGIIKAAQSFFVEGELSCHPCESRDPVYNFLVDI